MTMKYLTSAVSIALYAFWTLCIVAFGATSAQAHSALVSATPADGSTQSDVSGISLAFAEEIVPEYTSLVVTSSNGTAVTLDAPTMDATNSVVSVNFTDGMLVDGSYSIGYFIVSIDGHPIEGSVSFAVVGSPVVAPTLGASASASADLQTSSPQPTDSETPVAIALLARDANAADAGLSWVWIGTGIATVVVLAAVSTVLLVAIRRRRNESN